MADVYFSLFWQQSLTYTCTPWCKKIVRTYEPFAPSYSDSISCKIHVSANMVFVGENPNVIVEKSDQHDHAQGGTSDKKTTPEGKIHLIFRNKKAHFGSYGFQVVEGLVRRKVMRVNPPDDDFLAAPWLKLMNDCTLFSRSKKVYKETPYTVKTDNEWLTTFVFATSDKGEIERTKNEKCLATIHNFKSTQDYNTINPCWGDTTPYVHLDNCPPLKSLVYLHGLAPNTYSKEVYSAFPSVYSATVHWSEEKGSDSMFAWLVFYNTKTAEEVSQRTDIIIKGKKVTPFHVMFPPVQGSPLPCDIQEIMAAKKRVQFYDPQGSGGSLSLGGRYGRGRPYPLMSPRNFGGGNYGGGSYGGGNYGGRNYGGGNYGGRNYGGWNYGGGNYGGGNYSGGNYGGENYSGNYGGWNYGSGNFDGSFGGGNFGGWNYGGGNFGGGNFDGGNFGGGNFGGGNFDGGNFGNDNSGSGNFGGGVNRLIEGLDRLATNLGVYNSRTGMTDGGDDNAGMNQTSSGKIPSLFAATSGNMSLCQLCEKPGHSAKECSTSHIPGRKPTLFGPGAPAFHRQNQVGWQPAGNRTRFNYGFGNNSDRFGAGGFFSSTSYSNGGGFSGANRRGRGRGMGKFGRGGKRDNAGGGYY